MSTTPWPRGSPLTAEYDPLLAKLMVHAHDRPAAVARLRRALDETLVGGLQTDLGFHRWLVDHPGFVRGEYHTGLIADDWPDAPRPVPKTLLWRLRSPSKRGSPPPRPTA